MTITYGLCGHPLRSSKAHRAGQFCLVCDLLEMDSQSTMRRHRTYNHNTDLEGTYGEEARMRATWRGREDEANASEGVRHAFVVPNELHSMDEVWYPGSQQGHWGLREVWQTIARICPPESRGYRVPTVVNTRRAFGFFDNVTS